MCRAPLGEDSLSITYDLSNIGPQEDAEESQFVLPPELREQQAKMAELFAKQKAKGGIIDLEQEKNKYLINAVSTADVGLSTCVSFSLWLSLPTCVFLCLFFSIPLSFHTCVFLSQSLPTCVSLPRFLSLSLYTCVSLSLLTCMCVSLSLSLGC